MIKNIKLLVITLFISGITFSQNDTVIIKVNPVVGDTIDLKENNKFKLFNQFPNGQYSFAQYKIINDQVIVCITLLDNSQIKIPYSFDWVLRDSEKINLTSSNISISGKNQETNNKKTELKLTNGKKTKRIRKGQKIKIILYDKLANPINSSLSNKTINPNLIKARFMGINNDNKPTMLVKISKKGKPVREIALEDIQMIRFYTDKEYTFYLYTSITFISTGIFLLFASYQIPAILPVALILEYVGFKPYFRGNIKFDFSNDSEFIIY